ncbi:MAG: enoyl-CoA hydratase/isomerase family protein [Alphaproteobacteria bacterium]|nr:enoyl-CoA hydratase/isomerase family protein [Alphaproteobacteria bacterium]
MVFWEDRDAIGLLTLHRPKALNALNAEVMAGVAELLRTRTSRPDLRAVVITGSGGKAFAAGADIAAMQEFTPAQAEAFARLGQDLAMAVQACPVPVIAAVDGFALGGGCELAMCCDILIAGEKAKFGQPEVNLGVIPGFGGTQRLVRRVGMAAAMDLCLTGRIIGAQEAVAIGLASRAVEGSALDAALETAATIAAKGPVAVRLARRALYENADADLLTGLAAERSLFALCFATADQKEGMAAFLERRDPVYTGR